MKARTKKIINLIVSILIFALLIAFLVRNHQSFWELSAVKPSYLIPIFALTFLLLYLNGLYLKIITEPYGIDLKKHFQISTVSSFLNLIMPFKGGAGFRALYLKKIYNLNYSKFIASLMGNYVIIFLTSSLLAIVVFAIIYFKYQQIHLPFFFLMIAIFLGNILAITKKFELKSEHKIAQRINRVSLGWQEIKQHPTTLKKLLINRALGTPLSILRIYLIAQGLGIDLNLLKATFLSTLGAISSLINITPGGLGITEALYGLSAETLSITVSAGVAIALISRIVNILSLIIIGPFFQANLLKQLHAHEATH